MKNNMQKREYNHAELAALTEESENFLDFLNALTFEHDEDIASCCLDDEEMAYQQLLRGCDRWERDLIEEVADGDYWLAQSILHDLNKD